MTTVTTTFEPMRYPQSLHSHSLWLGFQQLLPLSAFVLVFGMAFGLAAQQTGLSPASTVLMSGLVFAGAAQFAVLDMWGAQVPLLPLAATVLAVNARHLLIGATLYPWLRQLPPAQRYAGMLVASDANWAMAMQILGRDPNRRPEQVPHADVQRALGLVGGGGLALWLGWVLGTWLGLYVGSAIADPKRWGLDLVMGCFLLAMVMGGPKNPRIFCIWAVAAGASLLAWRWLPENTHVITGALAGGALGAVWTPRLEHKA